MTENLNENIIKKEIYYKELDNYYNKKPNKKPFSSIKHEEVIQEILSAKSKKGSKSRREYHLLKTYDVIIQETTCYLVKKNTKDDDVEYIVCYEELFDIIYDCHVIKTNHGGRIKMEKALEKKYNIPRPALEVFLSCCKVCIQKKCSSNKIVEPLLPPRDYCERGHIDVIDFQSLPDGAYQWILSYQDHSTKFTVLRPIPSNCPEAVALELSNIFFLLGTPKILQSNIGREFVNEVITDLLCMWPESTIVNGQLLHVQNDETIERSNQDVKDKLKAWMTKTGSKQWSIGLHFVQWQKNCTFNPIIKRSPYRALFGCEPKTELSSNGISPSLTRKRKREEDIQPNTKTGKDNFQPMFNTRAQYEETGTDAGELDIAPIQPHNVADGNPAKTITNFSDDNKDSLTIASSFESSVHKTVCCVCSLKT